MTNITTTSAETGNHQHARPAGPFIGVVVFLVSLTIVAAFTIGGDFLEDALTVSQEELMAVSREDPAPSCPMPATLRIALPDLSRDGEAAWTQANWISRGHRSNSHSKTGSGTP
jgi:hypothetical protein